MLVVAAAAAILVSGATASIASADRWSAEHITESLNPILQDLGGRDAVTFQRVEITGNRNR